MFESVGLYIAFSQATLEMFFLVDITNSDSVKIMHQNNIWMKSGEVMALSNPNLGASTGKEKY